MKWDDHCSVYEENKTYLVSGGEESEERGLSKIEVWNFSSNNTEEEFLKFKHNINIPEKNEIITIDLISTHNENLIVSGGLDGKVIIYDLDTLESKIIIDNFLLGQIWTVKINKIDNFGKIYETLIFMKM